MVGGSHQGSPAGFAGSILMKRGPWSHSQPTMCSVVGLGPQSSVASGAPLVKWGDITSFRISMKIKVNT